MWYSQRRRGRNGSRSFGTRTFESSSARAYQRIVSSRSAFVSRPNGESGSRGSTPAFRSAVISSRCSPNCSNLMSMMARMRLPRSFVFANAAANASPASSDVRR
jgi:hypothetical protein